MGLIVVLAGGIFGVMPAILKYTLALIPVVMGLHLVGLIKLKLPGLPDWKPIDAARSARISRDCCFRW